MRRPLFTDKLLLEFFLSQERTESVQKLKFHDQRSNFKDGKLRQNLRNIRNFYLSKRGFSRHVYFDHNCFSRKYATVQGKIFNGELRESFYP